MGREVHCNDNWNRKVEDTVLSYCHDVIANFLFCLAALLSNCLKKQGSHDYYTACLSSFPFLYSPLEERAWAACRGKPRGIQPRREVLRTTQSLGLSQWRYRKHSAFYLQTGSGRDAAPITLCAGGFFVASWNFFVCCFVLFFMNKHIGNRDRYRIIF